MQYRKRKKPSNLVKRRTVPSEGGRSTTPGPVRFPSLPASLRSRPRGTGESGDARMKRLVRDTPGCQVCGSKEGLVYRKVNGNDRYRCPDHLNSSVSGGEVTTPARVKTMKRYNISDKKEE